MKKKMIPLMEIRIKSSPWVRRIFGAAAMVVSKKTIWVEDEKLKRRFNSIRGSIVSEADLFQWERKSVKLFLHEWYHILQFNGIMISGSVTFAGCLNPPKPCMIIMARPLRKVLYFWLRDMFKPHDHKQLEIEAENFAIKWYRATSTQIKDAIESIKV